VDWMDIKKLMLMALAWAVMISPSVMAYDMDVSIEVVAPPTPIPTVGLFSVSLFATVMIAGFVIYILKALVDIDLSGGNDLINRMFIIVVIGLLLASAIGIIFSI